MNSKTQLRAFGLEQRKSLSEHQQQLFSQAIMDALFEHLAAQSVSIEALLLYRSIASEVSTEAVFQYPDYRLFMPLTADDASLSWLQIGIDTQWQQGAFGVQEPVSGDLWQPQHYAASILLCPLTAFDRQGNRLGMGKGCFDRWLSRHHGDVVQVIGLAYSCQEVAQVPAEPHDMAMDFVITEKEVIACMNH